MPSSSQPPVILFGYDCKFEVLEEYMRDTNDQSASPFTNKVRLALRLKQIPFGTSPTHLHTPSYLTSPISQTYLASKL
jgi:hypothetical protein